MDSVLLSLLLIAIGAAVLVLGSRLAVIGAAVGALLAVGLLVILPSSGGALWLQLAFVVGLAVIGFFVAGFARGLIDVVLLVVGALGGAAIALGILDIFNIEPGLLRWSLAVVGGAIGLILMRRFRRGTKDWGIIILASLIGALLVTRGITTLLPSLADTMLRSLIAIVLAGAGFVYQGGFLAKRKAAKKAAAPQQAAAPAPAAKQTAPPPAPAAEQKAAAPDKGTPPPPASS